MTVKAGRLTKEDKIDHGTGIVLSAKIGDKVTKGQPIAKIYAPGEQAAEEAEKQVLSAYSLGEKAEKKRILLGYSY